MLTADISSAFLHGNLDVPIYMRMPDGSILKLLKSIYYLKQAAYKFKNHLDKSLTALGFKRLCCDVSFYIGFQDGNKILFTSHVGDLLFLSPNTKDIGGFQKSSQHLFNVERFFRTISRPSV